MPDALARLVAGLGRPAAPSSDFDLNPGFRLPEGRVLRPASVLVAFADGPQGPDLVLTKRASSLRHHPGQIAFPGGKQDAADPSPEAAALREAQEEVGLDPAQVRVLGSLPAHETVTGYWVTPVIGLIEGGFTPAPDPGEVEEVFRVPFTHIADPARFRVERRIWQGQWRAYYTVPFGPYYIWGATARILRGLAERVQS